MNVSHQKRIALLGAASVVLPMAVFGQDANADLAKAAQNPVAAMISLPIQANINFGVGDNDTGLVTQLWDFAGEDDRASVNLTSFQPIINYNIPNCNGWYLSATPVITYNWAADSDNAWTIPVGGGVGKVVAIGEQKVNAKIQAFGYLEAPDNGPDWSLQLQFTLLFPKK